MDVREAQILGDAVDQHWYYRSKFRMLESLLGDVPAGLLVDIGAGSGFFSRQLLATGKVRRACCVDTAYEADRDEDVAGRALMFRRQAPPEVADLLLLMDVLEHVDDDVALLREYVAPAASGTRFVISVPAFAALWSGHDVFLEHRRRYRLAQIEQVCRDAGLQVERGAYGFGLLFPLAAVLRIAGRIFHRNAEPRSQLVDHHPWTNSLLTGICRLELPLFRFNRVAGLTAFVLARKP